MDNQRSLFKKFFNASHNSGNTQTQVNETGGFNPPKFRFNKKKLGLGLINNGESSDKMANEIESVEIESEMNVHEYSDDNGSGVIDTIADSGSDSAMTSKDSVMTSRDSIMSTATWNTLNTMNIINTTNKKDIHNDENRPATTRPDYVPNKISNTSLGSLYSNTLEKNKQRYSLSNQLESFSMQLEVIERELEDERSKMDLLLLSFEEKLGKA